VCQIGQPGEKQVSQDCLVTCVLKKGVPPCRLAVQTAVVNESVGRAARGSSNQVSSRCCCCDRFAAGIAIIAFSGGLSVRTRGHTSLATTALRQSAYVWSHSNQDRCQPWDERGHDKHMIRRARDETRIVSKECVPLRSFERIQSR
jgi:hypothetical protein